MTKSVYFRNIFEDVKHIYVNTEFCIYIVDVDEFDEARFFLFVMRKK